MRFGVGGPRGLVWTIFSTRAGILVLNVSRVRTLRVGEGEVPSSEFAMDARRSARLLDLYTPSIGSIVYVCIVVVVECRVWSMEYGVISDRGEVEVRLDAFRKS